MWMMLWTILLMAAKCVRQAFSGAHFTSNTPFGRPCLEALEIRIALATYEAVRIDVGNGVEHRFKKDGFHFETLQTLDGVTSARSRPDRFDVNAFGTTRYIGPYVNVGAPRGTISEVIPSDSGIFYRV